MSAAKSGISPNPCFGATLVYGLRAQPGYRFAHPGYGRRSRITPRGPGRRSGNPSRIRALAREAAHSAR